MTGIAERVASLGAGGMDAWAILLAARRLQGEGVAVADLTIGEPDRRTAPDVLAAMDASARGGHTGYADLDGTPGLRAAVARRASRTTGVATTASEVLIVPGAQAGLFAACMALPPGGAVAVCDPHYATYAGTIRAAGLRVEVVATDPDDGFQPRPGLFDALPADVSALLVNTPNNPTGAVYDDAALDVIAGAAARRDLWVISDEVYDGQVWKGAHRSPRSLPGMAARTMVVGSMSKIHAMTGSRIGWIVAPEAVVRALTGLAIVTTYGVPGFVQDAAEHALSLGEARERENAAPFRARRDAALARLARTDAVGVAPPDGAMYLMLDLRGTGMTGVRFAETLLDRHRVAVMPGESFGAAAAGHVRVALTLPEERLLPALDALIAHAEAMS